MRRITLLFLLVLLVLPVCARRDINFLIAELKNPQSGYVFVAAHRGDWRNAPENSLQAVKNCIEMGVDIVEIDLKKTKDGQLILMHDKTIDRTTTGKGIPADYTLEELRKFYLKNGAGHKTAHKVPTLEEVLNLAKGKILLNIDKGYDYFKDVYALLQKTGTIDQVIVKSELPFEQVKSENGDVLKKVLFMPVVHLNKEGAKQTVLSYEKEFNPFAYECVFSEATPEVMDILTGIRKHHSGLWINSLWPELCGGHDDDKAVEQGLVEDSWGWLLKNGCTIIQTDRPALLINYLSEKGLR